MRFRCPICGKKLKMPRPEPGKDGTRPEFFPFCSERCKLLDLGTWLNGQYRIAESDSRCEKKDDED